MNKPKIDVQEKLFFFLDKIVNICLIKIERGEIKSTKSILRDLEDFLTKFWSLKQKNPGRFLSLVSSQEIYENACPIKIPGHLQEEGSFDAQCADNLKVQTLLQSQIKAGKELKGFSRWLSGFERIWERAFHYEQPEVTTAIFQILDRFLGLLLQDPYNDLFVEAVLKIYWEIGERLLKLPDKTFKEAELRGSLQWYQKFGLNRESLETFFGDFPYEDLLDQYFYKCIITIINHKQEDSFEIILNLLSEKTDVLNKEEHSLLDFFHIIEKGNQQQYEEFKKYNFFEETMESLQQGMLELDSVPKIRKWLKKEEALLDQIRPLLMIGQRSHFEEIQQDIEKHLIHKIQKQKINEITDATITYSLVRNKTFVIKALFTYHLPYDTYHMWYVDFILPKTVTDLLLFLNQKQKIGSKYVIAEGFSFPDTFYDQSTLVLLSYLLNRFEDTFIPTDSPQVFSGITMNGSTLNSIRCQVSSLIVTAYDMVKKPNILFEIGITEANKEIHWKEHVIPFLESLMKRIDQSILDLKTEQKLSPEKLEDFKQAIQVSFVKNAHMRTIFTTWKRYFYHKAHDPKESPERMGINVVDEKTQFLDQWENACSLQILDYGVKLAQSEDVFVFNQLRKNCQKITWEELDKKDPGFLFSDAIFLATDLSFQSVINKKDNFRPLWVDETIQTADPYQKGDLILGNQNIPVLVLENIKDEEGILILSRSQIGEWHQYNPLNEKEPLNSQIDFLYMNFQAFSENNDLLTEYQNHPPLWLREIGSLEKQKEYLMEHMLIHIMERFQWKQISFTTGYSLEDIL